LLARCLLLLCQLLDRYHAGWFSVVYWADMADLAVQASEVNTTAAGASASAAADAAPALAGHESKQHLQQLLRERHSIFYARCGDLLIMLYTVQG
jgi:hypothetical protein